jgi:predicted nucleic acid-binding protein
MARTKGVSAQENFLILDANVLIDYCASDETILTLIARHVGKVYVPSVLLEEVQGLDESRCEQLGLTIDEPDAERLVAAGVRRAGLSYYDHLCLLSAKDAGWTCVTNDGRLRRECKVEGVPVLWGLEPMIALVSGGHLSATEAERIARSIQNENPGFITDAIIDGFVAKISGKRRTR